MYTRILLSRLLKIEEKNSKRKKQRVSESPPPRSQRLFQGWRGITACMQFQNTHIEEILRTHIYATVWSIAWNPERGQ